MYTQKQALGNSLLAIMLISMMISSLLIASTHLVINNLDHVLLFRQRLVACEQADRALTLLNNATLTLPFQQTWLGVQVKGFKNQSGIHIQAMNQDMIVHIVENHGQWQEVDNTLPS